MPGWECQPVSGKNGGDVNGNGYTDYICIISGCGYFKTATGEIERGIMMRTKVVLDKDVVSTNILPKESCLSDFPDHYIYTGPQRFCVNLENPNQDYYGGIRRFKKETDIFSDLDLSDPISDGMIIGDDKKKAGADLNSLIDTRKKTGHCLAVGMAVLNNKGWMRRVDAIDIDVTKDEYSPDFIGTVRAVLPGCKLVDIDQLKPAPEIAKKHPIIWNAAIFLLADLNPEEMFDSF